MTFFNSKDNPNSTLSDNLLNNVSVQAVLSGVAALSLIACCACIIFKCRQGPRNRIAPEPNPNPNPNPNPARAYRL
jgi:hypothetical protein